MRRNNQMSGTASLKVPHKLRCSAAKCGCEYHSRERKCVRKDTKKEVAGYRKLKDNWWGTSCERETAHRRTVEEPSARSLRLAESGKDIDP